MNLQLWLILLHDLFSTGEHLNEKWITLRETDALRNEDKILN